MLGPLPTLRGGRPASGKRLHCRERLLQKGQPPEELDGSISSDSDKSNPRASVDQHCSSSLCRGTARSTSHQEASVVLNFTDPCSGGATTSIFGVSDSVGPSEAWERSGVGSAAFLVSETWLAQHFHATEPFGVNIDVVFFMKELVGFLAGDHVR